MAITGCITIQQGIYVDGKMFTVNQQYPFIDIVTQLTGCGCGNKPKKQIKSYKIVCNNINYLIPEGFAVETKVPISLRDQDFNHVFQREFKQDFDHTNYKDINKNCINCNQSIPHGDLNNSIDTGGSPRKLLPDTETLSPSVPREPHP